jgi:hypothetical protein
MMLVALLAATSAVHAAADALRADGMQSIGKRIDAGSLGRVRGGTEVVPESTLVGTVANNQAVNVSAGANIITGGAFAGASGVPVVIQNSGSNVLIQSSTVITVNLK